MGPREGARARMIEAILVISILNLILQLIAVLQRREVIRIARREGRREEAS